MRGHLVIADISGYTQFLTDSELEHAHGIIGELLNAVIGTIQAPLTVSSIQGDAVFMYGQMPEGTTGQAVLESVEMLYCSFASALETMVLNTTCQCNACVNISGLGLKIVMHCGEYVMTEIGGTQSLSGPDVIAVHRLLKNNIVEQTGIRDYMLVTQPCVDDLGIEDIVAGWTAHTEEYEHVGEVKGYISSLPDVWEFVRQQNENKVVQREAWLTTTAHSSAPPAIVWDHLVDPIKRATWMGANSNTMAKLDSGRIGPGSEYHCAHGDDNDIAIFTVLDRRPLDYITFVMPIMEGVAMRYTDYVIASGTGTRIVTNVAKLYSIDTGDNLSDDQLAELAGPVGDPYKRQLGQLTDMANQAAASLATM